MNKSETKGKPSPELNRDLPHIAFNIYYIVPLDKQGHNLRLDRSKSYLDKSKSKCPLSVSVFVEPLVSSTLGRPQA
jgi:hypothetical protein